jgi:hypothetical protein
MNEGWSQLTDDQVLGAGTKERQSIVAIKGKDDLPDICVDATEQIREAYRSGGREVGADGTIPDSMFNRAVAIALWRFVSEGVPQNDGIQTKPRKSDFDEAIEYLRKISMREIKGSGGAEIVSKQVRKNTRRRLDGLV